MPRGAKRGSSHHFARLTEDDVRNIRESIRSGERTEEIAARYSVSTGCIADIRTGYTWRHVKETKS